MKIIEALKQIKDLLKKAEDLRGKIRLYCVHLNYETPTYENQTEQVNGWLQAHSDILKEILRLRKAIQLTNLATDVTIRIGETDVTHSIAEWIHRRRDLAGLEQESWRNLTDKGLKEGFTTNSQGERIEVKIIRCYSPEQRDYNIELFRSEPTLIDAQLEITNAITDLME